MNRTKIIASGIIMATVAAVIQGIPAFLSETFALLTLASAIPVYTAARSNPLSGVISYVAAFLLLLFIDPGEGVNFLLTNGVVGLAQGLTVHFNLKNVLALAISSAALTVTSAIMNFGLDIPVLGVTLPGSGFVQLLFMLIIAVGYNFGFRILADFVYQKLQNAGIASKSEDESKKSDENNS